MRMANEGWIDKSQCLPTEQDADAFGCVEAWHIFNGVFITGWQRIAEERFFTHWMPTPRPPEGYEALRDTI